MKPSECKIKMCPSEIDCTISGKCLLSKVNMPLEEVRSELFLKGERIINFSSKILERVKRIKDVIQNKPDFYSKDPEIKITEEDVEDLILNASDSSHRKINPLKNDLTSLKSIIALYQSEIDEYLSNRKDEMIKELRKK